jgi:hypothetical protein
MPQPGQEGKRTCKREREARGNCPFKGPSGYGEWATRHKVDVVRRTGKEIYGEKLDGIT